MATSEAEPTNPLVRALLTDMYQLSMAYSYWKNKIHTQFAVFDLFFRKCPFKGKFTIFGGIEEALKFVQSWKIDDSDIAFLKKAMLGADEAFWDFLKTVNVSDVKLYALAPGQMCFPRQPLIRVEGSVLICQLLETTLLTLVNYPSLIATQAARFRILAPKQRLNEFGLRRAQGPDGGVSATRYSYMGGFDGTSNVLAAKLFGIPVSGTIAHSYVCSFNELKDLTQRTLPSSKRPTEDFVEQCLKARETLIGLRGEEKDSDYAPNDGELAAFISFAQAWPMKFLALVDTYDVIRSGVTNFLAVAAALDQHGYKAVGIRLDSGDLAADSKRARSFFAKAAAKFERPYFENFVIVASDDINEPKLAALEKAGHSIDTFGIGTHLVTCQSQPALGCVYKLVELNGIPRIKLATLSKMPLPGRKNMYRIYKKVEVKGTSESDTKTKDQPVFDYLTLYDEAPPKAGKELTVHDPSDIESEAKETFTPSHVLNLLLPAWDGKAIETKAFPLDSMTQARKSVLTNLETFLPEVITMKEDGPSYPLKVSPALHALLKKLVTSLAPKGFSQSKS